MTTREGGGVRKGFLPFFCFFFVCNFWNVFIGQDKRTMPMVYSFGLGKRTKPMIYSFGLGKRVYPIDLRSVSHCIFHFFLGGS